MPIGFSIYAGTDIGRDNGLVVDHKDNAQYAFTGTVTKVVFDLEPVTHEDEQIQASAKAPPVNPGRDTAWRPTLTYGDWVWPSSRRR